MKNIFSLLIILFSVSSHAESITAAPFSFSLYKSQDHLEIRPKISLECRHEIWVNSDSAEFEYKSLDIPLTETKTIERGVTRITYRSNKSHRLVLSGIFKPGKECRSEFQINFEDKKHIISRTVRKNIQFTQWTKTRYESGDSHLVLKNLLQHFDGRLFSLVYMPWPPKVHVELYSNNERINVLGVEKNPDSDFPYEIIKE